MSEQSSELYPLLLRPQFHERVWGTRSLAPLYSHEITGAPIGEAWLTGDACVVANGPLAGKTLGELSTQFGPELIGKKVKETHRFPLLIKFLFPTDKLSVQVHPDDDGARRVGQSCGKTECWYVLRAEPGAQIGLGLKPGTSKAEVERAIRETRMEQLLNWVDVQSGDMIYVDAGTVHAIGPGAVIVETQQNSDTTYRLYDYGRPRELHVEAGLLATKENTHAGKVRQDPPVSNQGKTQQNLVTSPCFIVDRFELKQPWHFQRPQHVPAGAWCLVATKGYGAIEFEGMPSITFTAGESVVIPASVQGLMIRPQWELEFLCSSVPVGTVPEPETVLIENADQAPV